MTKKQRDLFGNPIKSSIDPKRVRIKVCGHTQNVLQRAKGGKPYTMIEIAELGTKIAVVVLNNLTNEDIEQILHTNDQSEIKKTLSKLFSSGYLKK